MNEEFNKKTKKLYIISQNNANKNNNKKFNPILDQISMDNHDLSGSPKMLSFISQKINNNDELPIPIKSNSRFSSATRVNGDNFKNKSKISSFFIKKQSLKKNSNNKAINNYFQIDNDNSNNYNDNSELSKLLSFYENYKLKKYPSEKITTTTEIIQKKIRYHDLDAQTRKKSEKNFTPLARKNNKNNEEKYVDDPYITVYGVLFSKNNNLKYLKKKPNNLIMTNSNFSKNRLWKNKNNKNIFPLCLPWLNKKNNNIKVIENNNNFSKSNNKINNCNETDKNLSSINKDIEKNINKKMKKMICYDMISIPGIDHGRIKINQDSYFILPKLNDCEEVKIFGIFDGHGENGDKISKEIRDFFEEYFNKMFNTNADNENEKCNYEDNKKIIFMNALNNFKNITQFNSNNIKSKKFFRDKKNKTPKNFNLIEKFKNKKINFKLNEEKINMLNKKSFFASKIKYEKIKKIYNQLSNNNFSEIFSSYKKLDEILHTKYSINKFCHLSGSTSLILFLINSKNYNKIISTNLGDSKIISISQNNIIKELNITHTPNNPDEKNRVIKNGGEINRMDWSNVGPLRIWYKNKKYPGLSITRSFGDFESDELGVISEPDIKEYDIDEEKIKIIVFGTDGVWKFLTNDKVMDIVLPYYAQNDVKGATKKISEIAIKLWNVKNPKGIADVTVFVLFFK